MTSAISGRIIYKQGDRVYLDANIRSNSLVFDLTNNRLLYSPSGTDYFEFYPGPHSSGTAPVSGSIDWSNVLNTPITSNSTSGVLSVSDYNKFNTKADTSAIPSLSAYALSTSLNNYYPISSTGNISGLTSPVQTQLDNLSASLSGVGNGSYLPLSGGELTGQLKTTSISASGNISANSYVKANGTSTQFLKADGSTDSSNYLTSSIYSQSSRIIILNSATIDVSASDITSASILPFYMNGYRSKYFYISGTSAGSYSATIVLMVLN